MRQRVAAALARRPRRAQHQGRAVRAAARLSRRLMGQVGLSGAECAGDQGRPCLQSAAPLPSPTARLCRYPCRPGSAGRRRRPAGSGHGRKALPNSKARRAATNTAGPGRSCSAAAVKANRKPKAAGRSLRAAITSLSTPPTRPGPGKPGGQGGPYTGSHVLRLDTSWNGLQPVHGPPQGGNALFF